MAEPCEALPDEARLVALAANNPEAFGALYDRYFPQVFNFVRYRVGDLHAADDLTAKVFERALRHLPRYRAGAVPFTVWLFKIARNAVSDHYRSARRHPFVSLADLPEQEADSMGPVERAIEDETRQELRAAISRLDSREQEILALKFAARLTNREIARATGLGESNVGVTLYRVIRRLRTDLGGGESHE